MTKRKPTNPVLTGVSILDALDMWELVLRTTNRSPATIKVYGTAVRQFAGFTKAATVDEVTPGDVRAYLLDVLERTSATTAVTRWGGLLAFFKWAARERFVEDDPMLDVERPQRPTPVIPVLSGEQITAILNTCGTDFGGVRDAALIRVLLTTGMRRAECAGIQLADLDMKAATVRVMGKGSRERIIHVEDGTRVALARYLNHRRLHRDARSPALWLGKHGPLGGAGIQQVLERRAAAAGVERANPHMWRHTFAHMWLSKGGTEGALMSEAGWRSREMLGRYAASAASERARGEHARLAIGEGL